MDIIFDEIINGQQPDFLKDEYWLYGLHGSYFDGEKEFSAVPFIAKPNMGEENIIITIEETDSFFIMRTPPIILITGISTMAPNLFDKILIFNGEMYEIVGYVYGSVQDNKGHAESVVKCRNGDL